MTDIVNLRQARKRKLREAARAEGDANAARHGRRRDEREAGQAQARLEARRLDGHRRDGETEE